MIGNFLSPSGHTPQVCERLAELFRAQGRDIYTTSSKSHPLSKIFSITLDLLKYKNSGKTLILIDTFSGRAFLWAFWSALLCKFRGLPYIPVLHGGNLPYFAKNTLFSLLSHHYLRFGIQRVAPSPYLAKWVGTQDLSCQIIPNPLPDIFFNPSIRTSSLAYSSQPSGRILWLRRLHALYRPQLALLAYTYFLEWFPQATLTLVGPEGGEGPACKLWVKQKSFGNRIRFIPFWDAATFVRESQNYDVFLNTSRVDNTPSTLLEAAALHLPLVSTCVGGIPDLFSPDVHALLVSESENTALGLAHALRETLTQTQETNKRVNHAYQLALQRQWEFIQPQWDALFNSHPLSRK